MAKLRNITVSQENYEILRGLGHTSDSMNKVIMVILSKALQTGDSWKEPQSAKTQVPDGGESIG